MRFPPKPRFLDVRIAAVLLTLVGLASLFFIQVMRPTLKSLPDRLIQPTYGTAAFPLIVEMGGRIKRVDLREAQRVHPGDILIELDTRELQRWQRTLEWKIHQAETTPSPRRRVELANLYRELEQSHLEATRRTITSPMEGKLLSVTPRQVGEILKAGTALAIIHP